MKFEERHFMELNICLSKSRFWNAYYILQIKASERFKNSSFPSQHLKSSLQISHCIDFLYTSPQNLSFIIVCDHVLPKILSNTLKNTKKLISEFINTDLR